VLILQFLLMTDDSFKLSHRTMRSCSALHRSWHCEDFETMCYVDARVQG